MTAEHRSPSTRLDLETRLLEYFLAVCEHMHMTRAAESLGISQPTLSHQIRLLESRIGAPLFHRIGRKIHLTQAGEIVRSHARNVFHELAQTRIEIDELRGMKRGLLTIGCSGNHLLTEPMIAFHRQYPGVALSAHELATEETIERIRSNQLDLGVVFRRSEWPDMQWTPLFRESLQIAVHPDHEWAGLSHIRLKQLSGIPLFMLQPKFYVRRLLERHAEIAGVTLHAAVELSTLDDLAGMAQSGIGIAVLPRSYLLQLASSGIRAINITDPVPEDEIGIVYRKDTYMCSTMDTFVRFMVRHYEQDA